MPFAGAVRGTDLLFLAWAGARTLAFPAGGFLLCLPALSPPRTPVVDSPIVRNIIAGNSLQLSQLCRVISRVSSI